MKITFKENWHKEIIPATIFGIAVIWLLVSINNKL